VRLATPLLLACLAGLFSERAGIFDIGLEGKMLMAAFLSASVAFMTGSVWLGLLSGIGVSILLSLLHGLASITFRGNQLISAVAINFLAAGLTVLIAQAWFREGGRTPSLPNDARFPGWELPFALGPSDAAAAGRPLSELIAQAGPVEAQRIGGLVDAQGVAHLEEMAPVAGPGAVQAAEARGLQVEDAVLEPSCAPEAAVGRRQ